MSEKLSSSEKQPEKELQWQQLVEQFKKETDKLGYEIEPGIFDVVVGLNANGINTRQSCEGHVDKGRITPWVDITVPKPQNAKKFIDQDIIQQEVADKFGVTIADVRGKGETEIADRAREEANQRLEKQGYTPEYSGWIDEMKQLTEKAKAIVDEFNANRDIAEDVRIKIGDPISQSIYFEGTIYNGGKDYRTVEVSRSEQDKKELEQRLGRYREEMKAFADFLKGKFFE